MGSKSITALAIGTTIIGVGLLSVQLFSPNMINKATPSPHKVTSHQSPTANPKETATQAPKTVSTPKPLLGPLTLFKTTLTEQPVFKETNKRRVENQKQSLTRNATLDAVAKAKLDDIFENQYFDHVSPDGVGPADLAQEIGYDYIAVGENLALGNFESEQALVQAWMDSPGHRANILSNKFTQIGIAVGQGIYQGRQTWVAVQSFGTPLSACPTPDPQLKKHIDTENISMKAKQNDLAHLDTQLEELTIHIENLQNDIKDLAERGEADIQEGNEKIKQGNEIYEETGSEEQAQPYWDEGERLHERGQDLIAQAKAKQDEVSELQAQYEQTRSEYNAIVDELKERSVQSSVDTYNAQVNTYNSCVSQFQD